MRVHLKEPSLWVCLVLASVLTGVGCGDDDEGGGPGSVGYACTFDGQCGTGHCCESGNCGGGMCTYRCNGDSQCPPNMACEHDVCFFRCRTDFDCARGQSCEHDGVCEW